MTVSFQLDFRWRFPGCCMQMWYRKDHIKRIVSFHFLGINGGILQIHLRGIQLFSATKVQVGRVVRRVWRAWFPASFPLSLLSVRGYLLLGTTGLLSEDMLQKSLHPESHGISTVSRCGGRSRCLAVPEGSGR